MHTPRFLLPGLLNQSNRNMCIFQAQEFESKYKQAKDDVDQLEQQAKEREVPLVTFAA